jgi:hypothetical protein
MSSEQYWDVLYCEGTVAAHIGVGAVNLETNVHGTWSFCTKILHFERRMEYNSIKRRSEEDALYLPPRVPRHLTDDARHSANLLFAKSGNCAQFGLSCILFCFHNVRTRANLSTMVMFMDDFRYTSSHKLGHNVFCRKLMEE